MSGLLEEREVRSLLERGAADLVEVRAPLAAVLEGARRRRRAARIKGAAVVAAAVVAVVSLVTTQLGGASRSSGPASSGAVIDPDAGTVQLGGVTVKVPYDWTVDDGGRCPASGTVVVLLGVRVSGCGEGDSIVLSRTSSSDWSMGSEGAQGLQLLDGSPVWVQRGQTRTFVLAPYTHASVEIVSGRPGLGALLDSVSVAVPAAPSPVQAKPILVGRLDSPSDTGVRRLVTSAEMLHRATVALETAPVVPAEDWCVPEWKDQVKINLKTTLGSDPDGSPMGGFTSIVTAFTGDCRLAYSSTGAVVRPGPEFFAALGGPLHLRQS